MDVLGGVYGKFVDMMVPGPARDGDLAEVAFHVHGLQRMILAQAAARAYPERYRLRGGGW